MGKRILLVHDGRDGLSLGDRSSSLALGQELARFAPFDSIGRRTVSRRIAVGPLVAQARRIPYGPKAVGRLLPSAPSPAHHLAVRLLANLGVHADFVALSPRTSLQRFLRSASTDPELRGIRQAFQRADVVLVNGLGSLVFRDPPRRDLNFLLFALELAREMGKPAYLVNTMASDCPYSGTNAAVEQAVADTLRHTSAVLARDPMSRDRLEGLGLSNVRLVPDAVFAWALTYEEALAPGRLPPFRDWLEPWPETHGAFRRTRFPDDYVVISGASRHPDSDVDHWPGFFTGVVRRVKDVTGLPVVVLDSGEPFLRSVACDTSSIHLRRELGCLPALQVLANARAMISGRFHPSILASLGGVPCTFLEAGAHKTLSLQLQLGYEDPQVLPIDRSPANVDAVAQDVVSKLEARAALAPSIRETSAQLGREAQAGMATLLREALA